MSQTFSTEKTRKCFPIEHKMLRGLRTQTNKFGWIKMEFAIEFRDSDDCAIWMAAMELPNYYLNAMSSKSMNWMTNHLNPT